VDWSGRFSPGDRHDSDAICHVSRANAADSRPCLCVTDFLCALMIGQYIEN